MDNFNYHLKKVLLSSMGKKSGTPRSRPCTENNVAVGKNVTEELSTSISPRSQALDMVALILWCILNGDLDAFLQYSIIYIN